MDRINLKTKAAEFVKKYTYVLLILGIGLVLMLIPTQKNNTSQSQGVGNEEKPPTTEERLVQILSRVAGAGDVQVMLSESAGEEVVYQTNENYSNGNETDTGRHDTVTVTDSGRNESGLIRQIKPPVYMGAIILCQGADSPAVRLAIVEAVSDITGISTDKISVLKMK